MKCIKSKSGKTIERVKDEVAKTKVNSGAWSYCSKSEWKATRKSKMVVGMDMGSPDGDFSMVTVSKVHCLKAKDRKKLNKKK